jgi:hypothetical protein
MQLPDLYSGPSAMKIRVSDLVNTWSVLTKTRNRFTVIASALFMLLLIACSTESQEVNPPESEPEASVVASPTSVPAPPAIPSPTAKPGILKSTVTKVFGDSPTVEPAAAPDPVVAATVLGKSPVPDQTPESKPGVSASSNFSILTVDSSGSGLEHLAAAERYRVLSPPESAAITVDHDAATGYALVSGGEGAVPSNAAVLVANMELGNVAVVQADSKGAFATSIAAHAGTHLLVKQDSTTEGYSAIRSGIDEIVNSEQTGSPGIVLRVPVVPSAAESGGYSVAGGARVTDDGPPWIFEGNLSDIAFQPDGTFDVTGQIKVLTDIQSLDGVSFSFSGQMLGDETGYQIGPAGDFLSNIMTPTGLPIERTRQEGTLDIFSQNCGTGILEWRKASDGLVADVSCEVQVESDAPTGTYVTWLRLDTPDSVREAIQPSDKLLKLGNPLGQGNSIALATVTVGPAEPLRLTTTLLADLLQEGTRGGVLAREDADRLAIGSRIITHHNPIVARLDPYGDPWRHRLDPYLPLMGITDRAPPAVPLIAFDFSNSELMITVERPDGKTDVLGPGPFTAYSVKTPTTPDGNQIAGGGGNIGEIPQLLGQADMFEYQFPLDGDYVVHLAGHIADENGQILEVTGTFDLVVANSLDIETLLLPGTPFEVGDSLPVGLQVYPGVPADVRFTVTHIGADNAVTKKEYTGTASTGGWWDGDGQSFLFAVAGEYLVEAEARYPDTEERLWAGRMKYGGVVATPDGPIIAHGLRGHDALDYIPPPWGFGIDFSADGHLQFPYFTGDILWGMEGPENRGDLTGLDHFDSSGPGDTVNVGLSMQIVDEDHPLVKRALKLAEGSMPEEKYKDLLKAGQVPLITTPEENDPLNCRNRCGKGAGGSMGIRPEELSLLAYTYGSAQRPGVRVRELIQGEGASSAYWRFGDAYHMQSGNGREGDLPGDFKFMYGGTVIRDIEAQDGVFAIYGSGWVLTDDDDPMGSRFMPPFQGNAGGPNGGPLFTLHGREIDMFFVPLAVRPGAVLEVGDIFRMAGPIMPTLPSRVEYTVTAPDGSTRSFDGRGNAVGYFYDPQDDFELDKPGLWMVDLGVTHDGMTSAGPVQEPYPRGGPLTPDGRTFTFIVKDSDTLPLNLSTDLTMLRPINWYSGGNERASFAALLPQDWTGTTGHVTVTMPGIVLVDTEIPVENGSITWELYSEDMNQLADNFDTGGLADTVTVTYHLKEQSGRTAAGTIVTHGNRVPRFLSTGSDTPSSLKGLATDQTDCLANEAQLFNSNFENGTPGWEFSDPRAWSVIQTDDSNTPALRGEGHVHAFAGENWGEVVWRMLVKIINGNVHLNFHSKDGNRYIVSFDENGTRVTRGEIAFGGSGISHTSGEWHVVEIGLQKGVFYVAVDGYLEIEQTEPDPLPPGGIWLEVLDDSEVLFDEIFVCKPGA